MYNEVIELIKVVNTINDIGDPVEVKTSREVFAQMRSIGMKETYEAMSHNLKPEMVFILSDYYDYDDEDVVKYNEVEYRVLRTYRKGTNELEIVVTR